MAGQDLTPGADLVPAIVQDADTGRVLMLAYMDAEARRRTGTYLLVHVDL